MSVQVYLAQYDVTVAQARQFIVSHLDTPLEIFNTAHLYGITNDMLAEIIGGVSASDVRAWLNARGFNASLLNGAAEEKNEFLSAETQVFASLISLNSSGDSLANVALRERIVTQTGLAAYNQAFDPQSYQGADDGVFSSAELGIPGLGDLTASRETLESLYFGTAIKAFRAIDPQEISNELLPFVSTNQVALAAGSPAITQQYLALLVSIFEDVATKPMFTNQQIADSLVEMGVSYVNIIGSGQTSDLFGGILTDLLPT